MFLKLYGLHFIKHLKDFVTNIYIRHHSGMCRPYLGDLKVLNHRSKDFFFFFFFFLFFFSCIFLDGSRGSFHWIITDTHASASDNLIGSDFYRSSVRFAQK